MNFLPECFNVKNLEKTVTCWSKNSCALETENFSSLSLSGEVTTFPNSPLKSRAPKAERNRKIDNNLTKVLARLNFSLKRFLKKFKKRKTQLYVCLKMVFLSSVISIFNQSSTASSQQPVFALHRLNIHRVETEHDKHDKTLFKFIFFQLFSVISFQLKVYGREESCKIGVNGSKRSLWKKIKWKMCWWILFLLSSLVGERVWQIL